MSDLVLGIITFLLLLCMASPDIDPIESDDILWMIILAFFMLGVLLFSAHIDFSLNVTKKPIVSIRAKVMSKNYSIFKSNFYSCYRVVFLVNDKIELKLGVSKKQYKAIEKNDIVDLVYQGMISRSIKKLSNGTVILNEDYHKKIK